MSRQISRIREPGSSITHFIGMMMAVFAAIPLLISAAKEPDPVYLISLAIFVVSMIMLYAASTIYHTFDINPKVNKALKRLDHLMIFVMIAGSYTPICLLVLERPLGLQMLALVWGIAIVGGLVKWFWIYCPKWFSSVLYIAMGWICLLAFGQIMSGLTHQEFLWLLLGGIIYTVGGVIYALKLPLPICNHKYFGNHELFHLFVMGGSACHFVVMFFLVAAVH